jgi:hypothetical protein
MIDTLPELMDYLADRGSYYGISAFDLYEAIPESARTPEVAYEYMTQKDISHKIPLSQGGERAGDNWILEDSSVNRSRGAQNMTPEEEATAHEDAQHDADHISSKHLLKMAISGGGLAAGGAVVEGAVLAGEIAGGAAVAAAEATVITTVVVPVVVTTAIVGAVGYGAFRLFKRLSK